jgi:valyl-tRNA synthetase
MYGFCWTELCDWYLESIKQRIRSEDARERAHATQVLAFVLDRTLRMLHPVMPHLTEELAVRIWGDGGLDGGMVTLAQWHERVLDDAQRQSFAQDAAWYEQLQATVTRVRALRQAAAVKPSTGLSATLVDVAGFAQGGELQRLLAALANVQVSESTSTAAEALALRVGPGSLVLSGLDASVLRPQLEVDLKAARSEVARATGKLANERFIGRAPAELVAEERAKLARYEQDAAQLEAMLAQM